MMSATADIALVGLSVRAQNIILNMNDHGFVVCAFNPSVEKMERFLENKAKGTKVIGAKSLKDMVSKLKTPRRVMLLVKAGSDVDAFIDQLVPLLNRDDIIIDGAHSDYLDTNRRERALREKGLFYVGCGVYGSEYDARYGPSIMPGGAAEAWPHVKDIFQSIAAQVGTEPCCDWVGPEGAGHFMKIVHNAIEYGDMQLCCEAYHMMKESLGMSTEEMSTVFAEWNKGPIASYFVEVTGYILAFNDTDHKPLLEKIVDAAEQKSSVPLKDICSLQYSIPITLFGEAMFALSLSSFKSERVEASKYLKGPSEAKYKGDKKEFIEHIRQALCASRIVSCAQGFMILREVAKHFGWKLNMGGIAHVWRGACLARSAFLGNIREAFDKNPDLTNLLLDNFFKDAIHQCQDSWRQVVSQSVLLGVPTPGFSTALAFYDGYRSERLPANLIQAHRDYFGAHTYETFDKPGTFVHTNWNGHGGNVSFSKYKA